LPNLNPKGFRIPELAVMGCGDAVLFKGSVILWFVGGLDLLEWGLVLGEIACCVVDVEVM
jgi:hypothetical protein